MSTTSRMTRMTAKLALGGLVLMAIGAAQAGVEIFVEIDGIKGESQATGYEQWIDALSVSLGAEMDVSQVSGTGGYRGGRSTALPVVLTKLVDRATPRLLESVFRGQVLPEVTIAFRRAGENQGEFLTIKLTNVLVTRVGQAARVELDQPAEEVGLFYEEIELEYQMFGPDGRPDGAAEKMTWNVVEQR